MANNPNMQVDIGVETSRFDEGLDKVVDNLEKFGDLGQQVASKIGDAFGVDISKVQKLILQFTQTASKELEKMGGAGNEALAKIVAAAGEAAAGIASIGIVAATAAFKLLNAEAEAFRNTIEGANLQLQTQVYLETYRRAMHEFNTDTGKTVAVAQERWKRFWETTKTDAGTFGLIALTQPIFSGTQTLGATLENALDVARRGHQEATAAAQESLKYSELLANLQNKQAANAGRWFDMEQKIVELKEVAGNIDASRAQRQAAANEAIQLTNQLYNEQYDLQLMVANITELVTQDAKEGNIEVLKANEYLKTQKTEIEAINSLLDKTATITAAQRKEWEKTQAAIARGVSRMQEFATFQIEMGVSDESRAQLAQFSQVTIAKPIEVPVRLETEEAEQQILNLSETIQSTIVEAISGMAASIGELLGNAINGEGGMAEFGQDVLTMIGTFAEKFGKVLVAYGAAVLAFESAFENPYAAIAAGAGLIVLGAMVKQIASNMSSSIGSGASSQSSYVASSGSYGAGGYSNSTLQVEVTGTLTANGSQLVAVLNNENNRTNYTT